MENGSRLSMHRCWLWFVPLYPQFLKSICDSKRNFVLQYKQVNTAMGCWNHCCPTCIHTMLVTAHKAHFCAILWKFPFCDCYKILLNLPNFQHEKKGTQVKSLLFIVINIFLSHHHLGNQCEISDALLSISIKCKNVHCPKFLQLLIPFIFTSLTELISPNNVKLS